jgi:hypothetical protein
VYPERQVITDPVDLEPLGRTHLNPEVFASHTTVQVFGSPLAKVRGIFPVRTRGPAFLDA